MVFLEETDTLKAVYHVPLDYADCFGGYALNETDMRLFDAMIADRLPEEIIWSGDELLAPVESRFCDDGLCDCELASMWQEAVDSACDEFFTIQSDEDFRTTAERYDVDLPWNYHYRGFEYI